MKSSRSSFSGGAVVALLGVGIFAAPLGAGAQCYDIFQNDQITPDCTQGAVCYKCELFDDVRVGTKWLIVTSDVNPRKVVCQPGTVSIDIFGACVCFHDWSQGPSMQPVPVITGSDPCHP